MVAFRENYAVGAAVQRKRVKLRIFKQRRAKRFKRNRTSELSQAKEKKVVCPPKTVKLGTSPRGRVLTAKKYTKKRLHF